MTHTSFFTTPSKPARLEQLEPAIAQALSVTTKLRGILIEFMLTTEAGLFGYRHYLLRLPFG